MKGKTGSGDISDIAETKQQNSHDLGIPHSPHAHLQIGELAQVQNCGISVAFCDMGILLLLF